MRYICGWCEGEGQVIGDGCSFPGTRIIKCNMCHHEWEGRDQMTPEEIEESERFFAISAEIAAQIRKERGC